MAVCGPGGHHGRSEGTTGEVRAGQEHRLLVMKRVADCDKEPGDQWGDLSDVVPPGVCQYQKTGRGADPDWTFFQLITPALC